MAYVDEETLQTELAKKVDKVSGKELSTNDYTNDEKRKLAGIEEAANNYKLPVAAKDVIGGVKTTSTVTQATINEYTPVPIVGGVPYYKDTRYDQATATSPGLMSAADKAKLDSLSTTGVQPASASSLGGVKVGSGLTVASDGTLSAKQMTGATENANGAPGMVPAAASYQHSFFLRGDGTWGDYRYVLPEAEIDQLGGVRLGDSIRKVNGKITVETSDGMRAGIVPANDAVSKVFTGRGWKKLDGLDLPLITDDAVGCVKVPVVQTATEAITGHPLEVIGDATGKLYAAMPYIADASGAAIPGATDTVWGPKHGLMSGADKEKLDHIDAGANNYVLPLASTEEAGGVLVGEVAVITPDTPLSSEATDAEIAEATEETITAMVERGELIKVVRLDYNGVAYAMPPSALASKSDVLSIDALTNAEIDAILV